MRDTLTSGWTDDFRKRYAGSYGWYEGNGKTLLVKVLEVESEYMTFEDVKGIEYKAYTDSGVIFNFLPVTRGWYTGTDGKCYYMCRIPAKQWCRGINNSNTFIGKYQQYYNRICATSWGLNTLINIFDNKVDAAFTKNQIKSFLEGEVKSCVASRFFMFNNKDVYFLNQLVGTIDKNTKTIQLSTPLIEQELKDLMVRNNISGVTIDV